MKTFIVVFTVLFVYLAYYFDIYVSDKLPETESKNKKTKQKQQQKKNDYVIVSSWIN